jgi:uncharacterized membrane protein
MQRRSSRIRGWALTARPSMGCCTHADIVNAQGEKIRHTDFRVAPPLARLLDSTGPIQHFKHAMLIDGAVHQDSSAQTHMSLTFAFLIGLLTGLRCLTPAAATAWAAYLGWLHLPRSLAWMGTLTAVVIFSALALFELINDKRPTTPARTAPPGLVARVVLGAFAGTCVAAALGAGLGVGLALGIVGALAGTFGGYQARTGLVKALGTRDLYIALLEDAVTIAASFFLVSHL